MFQNKMNEIFEKHKPSKFLHVRSKDKSWLNQEQKIITKKEQMYYAYL